MQDQDAAEPLANACAVQTSQGEWIVLGEHPVSVISSAVLRAGRDEQGEDSNAFAARAGIAPAVVAAIEDGAHPAWALAAPDLEAVAVALSQRRPGLGQVFTVATACDLLLTSLVNGDTETEEGTLAALDGDYLAMARSLLAWAVTGSLQGAASKYLQASSNTPLLQIEFLSKLAGRYVMPLLDRGGS